MKRSAVIIISVAAAVVIGTGLGVLIWWLVTRGDASDQRYQTILLEGDGFEDVEHRAAFTRIPESGDMFWLFYPTVAENPASRPIVLWLDGVTGHPPSSHANFGMIGPLDFNLNKRSNSWIDQYNLLFVDGPLGSGFSTISDDGTIATNTLVNNTNHLILALESFYGQHTEFSEAPLYIFGQGYGGQFAASLALGLKKVSSGGFSPNLKGIVLGNAIISPAEVLTKLGFYLEEWAYIDFKGREAIENWSNETNELVNEGQLEAAFDNFLTLDEFVDENAGAVAVNLAHIVEKMTRETSTDYFGQNKYLEQVIGFSVNLKQFMDSTVAPALGIANPNYNGHMAEVIESFKGIFMTPAKELVDEVLSTTDLTVTIYNGNLDAVSNTPGQLLWVNNLHWSGQQQFLSSPRQTLVINRLVEGYFRETDRLAFYWVNAAGLLAPLDNPTAMRRIIQRVIDGS